MAEAATLAGHVRSLHQAKTVHGVPMLVPA